MKIAVNTQHLLKNRLEGIGWFAHETLKRMVLNHPEHQFLFMFDRPWDESFIYASNVTPLKTLLPSRHPLLWMWHYELEIAAQLRQHRPALFFSPDGWMPLNTSVPVLDVIHDINFVHRPEDFPWLVRSYYNYFFPRFAQKAKRIVTVSEYSKNDIALNLKVDPEKIDVAYNGVNPSYTAVGAEIKHEIRKQFTAGAPYFIYIGSRNPRKNITGLLEAFEKFKVNDELGYKLLFVGEPMWKKSYLNSMISNMKFKDDLVFTGRLSSEVLHLVLASADALALVSFAEGFGIPVVEAMSCDVPVLCANTTSLPEVAGDAALLVDPSSSDEIARAFSQLAQHPDLRKSLIIKGQKQRVQFTWDQTARTVWNSIEKTLE